MAKQRETKVGKFLQKVTKNVPALAGDVLQVVTSPNPGGAVFGKLKDKLKSKETGAAGDLLLEEAETITYEDFQVYEIEEQSKQRATSMYPESKDTTDHISKKIFKFNLPYILSLVLLIGALNLGIALWVPPELQVTVLQAVMPVVTIIGTVVGSLLDERKQVTGFFLGSSKGSREKDKK